MQPAREMYEDDITAEEASLLTRFKGVTMARGYDCPRRADDQTLLRFLRAKQLDLRKALAMYGDFVQWRRVNNVDSLLQTFQYPELDRVLRTWPQNWHKTDKLGRPINIQLLSRLRIQELFRETTEERLLKRVLWVWEDLHEVKLPACSAAAGHYVGRATVIIDLKCVSTITFTNSHVRKVLPKLAKCFSSYFPEYLGRLIIINTPATFKLLWEMLSPFIDDQTQKRIRIHKGNGLDDLLDAVDAADLPLFLGGTCDCPGGCMDSAVGPWAEPKQKAGLSG